MKNRLKNLSVIVIIVVVIFMVSFQYYSFVSRTIYNESVSHLSEILHQANLSLTHFVDSNWVSLHGWADYIEDVSDEKEIEKYIRQVKEENNFTDFYFVSQEGNFQTVSGESGYLNLADSLSDLMLDEKDVRVSSVIPGQSQLMMFFTPVSGTFHGFKYDAVAISFNKTDLLNSFKINSFDNKVSSFLIHKDGRVILDNAVDKKEDIYNFVAMLEKYSNLSSKDILEIRENLKKGTPGATIIKIDNINYYMIYEPVEFDDWTLVGLVPTSVVNSNMNKLQLSTMFLVAAVMIVIGIVLLSYFVKENQLKLKKKDKQIVYRDELFSKLSIHVDAVFFMLDARDFHVEYISPNVEKILGVSEKLVRENIHELDCISKTENIIPFFDSILNLKSGQQNEWDVEYVHNKTGEERWAHVIVLCSMVEEEKKYIIVMSDRTEDRRVNQALEESVKAAESANRAKSTFLSSISHDIRTPMNAILGYTTLASMNIENDEKVKEYLSKITSAGNFLLSLINDVLDMSRIESGKIYLEETEVNILEDFNNLKTIISEQINNKHLNLVMDTSNVVDKNIYCDKKRMNRVLLNLLSNAIKFTDPGDTISVRVSQLKTSSKGKGLYEIRIKDTGIGMSKEFVEKIFNPFEREQISTVSRIPGSGLGMSIAKNIIDIMGGTIDVITEQGKGTEFIVKLEFRLALADKNKAETKDQESLLTLKDTEKFRGKKILLAEDNDLNSEIIVEILESYGFQLDVAENGKEAVDIISSSNVGDYDLILMDIQMPVMDGYTATQIIRGLNGEISKIPIIAITANALEEDKANALALDMNGYVTKPIDIPKLIDIIAGMLE